MLLAVNIGPTLEDVITPLKGCVRIAELEPLWWNDEIAVRGSDARIDDRIEWLDVDRDLLCRFSCAILRLCQDDRDRLALKMNFAVSEQRLIRDDPADLIFTDDVLGGYNAKDPGTFLSLVGLDAIQLSMCYRRIEDAREERSVYERDVVEIDRLAANVRF